ncbi:hypothetical protein M514_11161, partial [Trichuris suis]
VPVLLRGRRGQTSLHLKEIRSQWQADAIRASGEVFPRKSVLLRASDYQAALRFASNPKDYKRDAL